MTRRAIALREDYDGSECRRLARNCDNARMGCRLLALGAIYDGMSRSEAARIGGMDRQTLRDWVHRFNEEGPAGLCNRKHPGPKCRLSDEQLRELVEIVEAGPDLESDGVVRWRRVDLQQVIDEKFNVTYHPHYISKLLHKLGLSHISTRPQHAKQDPQTIEDFKKTFQTG